MDFKMESTMKKNTFKILFTFLSLGITSSNVLYSAQQSEESDLYESLRAGTSNATSTAIGFYAGTTLVDDICNSAQISSHNIKNVKDANRTLDPSLKTAFIFCGHCLCIAAMNVLSTATIGKTKEHLGYFAYGFLAGAGKKTLSRLSSYLNREEAKLCAICQEENAPVNPDAHDIINTHTDIKTLHCGHAYHKTCIAPWLAEHTTCPSCRAVVNN